MEEDTVCEKMSNVHVTVLKNAPARSPKQEIQATAATAH